MARAGARHILVETEQQCEELKSQIEAGADFAEIAQQHSKCPSATRGRARLGLSSCGKSHSTCCQPLRPCSIQSSKWIERPQYAIHGCSNLALIAISHTSPVVTLGAV